MTKRRQEPSPLSPRRRLLCVAEGSIRRSTTASVLCTQSGEAKLDDCIYIAVCAVSIEWRVSERLGVLGGYETGRPAP